MLQFARITALSLIVTAPAVAQKLVDPNTVAPEYREAAEHRRAEQIKQRDCIRKADLAKIAVRDRTEYVLKCLEADASK
jgi:hypothetical protein